MKNTNTTTPENSETLAPKVLDTASCSAGEELENLRVISNRINRCLKLLEDDYPRWNNDGKAHAISSSIDELKDAHNIVKVTMKRKMESL